MGKTGKGLRVVKVWDGFVRFFHWTQLALLVGLVVSAHVGWQEIHMFLGFSLAALALARLAWGFWGSEHARFSSFVTSPLAALRYLVAITRGHPERYLGHNPAGGWMVLVLLGVVCVALVTGLALQATLEFEGPLVAALRFVDDRTVGALFLIHEIAVNSLYLLVPLHLLGVALAGRQHHENLVMAMISGNKFLNTER